MITAAASATPAFTAIIVTIPMTIRGIHASLIIANIGTSVAIVVTTAASTTPAFAAIIIAIPMAVISINAALIIMNKSTSIPNTGRSCRL